MKILKKICLGGLFLLFLVGCCPVDQADTVPYRIVTQVDVIYENGPLQLHRQFFQEESIRQVIDYLRFIDPYGTPREDPEQLSNRKYEITLTYSDGLQHHYQQRSDRYFRIGEGPWQCIDSQRALYLSGILGMMPDETP